jgi:hypothetical protein
MSESTPPPESPSSVIYTGTSTSLREFFALDQAVSEAQFSLSYLLDQSDARPILTSHQHGVKPELSLTNRFLNVAQSALTDIQNGTSPSDLSELKKLSLAAIKTIFSILNQSTMSKSDTNFEWFAQLNEHCPNAVRAFNSIRSKAIWNDLPDRPSYELPHLNCEAKLIEAYQSVLGAETPKP